MAKKISRLWAAVAVTLATALLCWYVVIPAIYDHYFEYETALHRVDHLVGSGRQFAENSDLVNYLWREIRDDTKNVPNMGFLTPETLFARGRHYTLIMLEEALERLGEP